MSDEKDYAKARERAQKVANATGMDVGLERNPLFGTWSHRILPRRENRFGFELRMEVVSPEDIKKTRAGHGAR